MLALLVLISALERTPTPTPQWGLSDDGTTRTIARRISDAELERKREAEALAAKREIARRWKRYDRIKVVEDRAEVSGCRELGLMSYSGEPIPDPPDGKPHDLTMKEEKWAGTWDPSVEIVLYVRSTEEVHGFDCRAARARNAALRVKNEAAKRRYDRFRRAVHIGARDSDIAAILKPERITRTVQAGGVREQWVYSGGALYLYFDNGRLTSWQESGKPN